MCLVWKLPDILEVNIPAHIQLSCPVSKQVPGDAPIAAAVVQRQQFGLDLRVGQIRRTLFCAFVRAESLCLLARLGQLGPGARSAAERRGVAQRVEISRRREAQAYWLAHIRGRGLGRAGMVFVP